MRGEHCGGLIEDQHLGLPRQRLDDLDPLLRTDRQFADHGVRIDVETEALRQLGGAPASLDAIDDPKRAGGFIAQRDRFGDGEDRDEHEVLVHHADAGRDRVAGALEDDGLAVDDDLALVGGVEPVEHVHQGGFAGAVLAQQGVDLAGFDPQVDLVVGHQRAEPLGDALQFKQHCLASRC